MPQTSKAERGFKTVLEEYVLEVRSFDVRMSSGINVTPESPACLLSLDAPLYETKMELSVSANCLAPKRFKGEECKVIISNSVVDEKWSKRVSDVLRKDEHGMTRYLHRGRDLVPDFDTPSSVGYINKKRDRGPRCIHVFVPLHVVQEFRTALSLGQAPRLFLDVRRTGFDRVIRNVEYGTPGFFER